MATSTFTQLLSPENSPEWFSSVQCCFTSTECVRTIRGGEPRTSTLTFTQLLSSGSLSAVLSVCLKLLLLPPALSLCVFETAAPASRPVSVCFKPLLLPPALSLCVF